MLRFTLGLLTVTLLGATGIVTIFDLVVLPRFPSQQCVQYGSELERTEDRRGEPISPDSGTCDQLPCTAEVKITDRLLFPDESTRRRTEAPCN